MFKNLLAAIVFVMSMVFVAVPAQQAYAAVAPECNKTFFNLPTWYKYLDVTYDSTTGSCSVNSSGDATVNAAFLIGLAVFEILLVFAGLFAVAFVIYGGYKFIIAQGEPDKIAGARKTILNALVGFIIAVIASQVVSFIAGRLS